MELLVFSRWWGAFRRLVRRCPGSRYGFKDGSGEPLGIACWYCNAQKPVTNSPHAVIPVVDLLLSCICVSGNIATSMLLAGPYLPDLGFFLFAKLPFLHKPS